MAKKKEFLVLPEDEFYQKTGLPLEEWYPLYLNNKDNKKLEGKELENYNKGMKFAIEYYRNLNRIQQERDDLKQKLESVEAELNQNKKGSVALVKATISQSQKRHEEEIDELRRDYEAKIGKLEQKLAAPKPGMRELFDEVKELRLNLEEKTNELAQKESEIMDYKDKIEKKTSYVEISPKDLKDISDEYFAGHEDQKKWFFGENDAKNILFEVKVPVPERDKVYVHFNPPKKEKIIELPYTIIREGKIYEKDGKFLLEVDAIKPVADSTGVIKVVLFSKNLENNKDLKQRLEKTEKQRDEWRSQALEATYELGIVSGEFGRYVKRVNKELAKSSSTMKTDGIEITYLRTEKDPDSGRICSIFRVGSMDSGVDIKYQTGILGQPFDTATGNKITIVQDSNAREHMVSKEVLDYLANEHSIGVKEIVKQGIEKRQVEEETLKKYKRIEINKLKLKDRLGRAGEFVFTDGEAEVFIRGLEDFTLTPGYALSEHDKFQLNVLYAHTLRSELETSQREISKLEGELGLCKGDLADKSTNIETLMGVQEEFKDKDEMIKRRDEKIESLEEKMPAEETEVDRILEKLDVEEEEEYVPPPPPRKKRAPPPPPKKSFFSRFFKSKDDKKSKAYLDEDDDEKDFECPECGAMVGYNDYACPECGVEFE